MPETLTRGEAQVVFTDLKNQIDALYSQMKTGGVLNAIQYNQSTLQDHLNTLLKKGGLITEEDYNKAYNLIKESKKQELDRLQKKDVTNLTIGIGVIVLGVMGYFIYKKYKK